MALKPKKRTNYDDDYDLSKSYDDYDYGRVNEDEVLTHEEDDADAQENGRILLWTAVNNTALFLLAYMLQFLVYQSATMGMAYRRFMNSIMRYYITNITPVGNNWLINRKAIVWIYSAGPVACLFVSLVALVLYYRVFQRSTSLLKPFMIWIFLAGCVFSFGSIGAGILVTESYRGVGYAVAWGGNSMVMRYIYLGVATIFMLLIGFIATRPFLQSATRAELVKRRGGARSEYLLFSVIIPAGIGGILTCLFRLPAVEYYDIIALLFLIPSLLAMLSYGRQIASLRIIRTLDDISISKAAIIISLTFALAFRIMFDPGIHVNAFDPALEKIGSFTNKGAR